IKHAGASEVRILIKRDDAELSLTIQDNGRGFNISEGLTGEAQTRREGLGMIGIRERAAILGGRALINSEPGRGTTVLVKFNLKGTGNGA
ncbi:MAG: sensor histidine kinase, partial [Acidobacteria bacterium]|nr:sensor histidine kinase [Acidobacteriota bacterium]